MHRLVALAYIVILLLTRRADGIEIGQFKLPSYQRLRPRTVGTVALGSALCGGSAALLCSLIRRPFWALAAAIPTGALLYAAVLLASGELREELQAVRKRFH